MSAHISKIYQYIDENFDDHLEKIREFLRQPSISADGTGIRETANMVKEFIENLGGVARIVPTDGWPIVYGELISDERKPTLLFYSMYDTMPADEPGWIVPPFSAEIVNMDPFGPTLVARGALNTKGPLRAFFNALESILAVEKELPVNIIFVIEGEEELGSPNIPKFVKNYANKLKRANAMYFHIPAKDRDGRIRMHLGVKGIVYLELYVRGGDWGGPTEHGIHSSNAAWVDSPVWMLIHALSSMKSPDGKILIDGFYDDIRDPLPEELMLIRNAVKTFKEDTIKEQLKVRRFINDLRGEALIKQYIYSPTLNIDGIIAGYTGPGTKTVLPHEALAKIDIRLVPNMDPDDVVEKLKKHLIKHGFNMVNVRVRDKYPWAYTSLNEPVVKAMIDTYREHGYEPEIWPWLGGSAPFYAFNRDPLNLPFVFGGLGHAGNAHAPNEYFVVEDIKENEKGVVTFLYKFASIMEG